MRRDVENNDQQYGTLSVDDGADIDGRGLKDAMAKSHFVQQASKLTTGVQATVHVLAQAEAAPIIPLIFEFCWRISERSGSMEEAIVMKKKKREHVRWSTWSDGFVVCRSYRVFRRHPTRWHLGSLVQWHRSPGKAA